MSVSDPISDMLTRIRNATRARHRYVDIRKSRFALSILEIFKSEGFIQEIEVKEMAGFEVIRVYLKYAPGRVSLITDLKRVSKPGVRRYVNCEQIPKVCGGLGVAILSTSKGVMTGRRAHQEHVGGELVCTVW